MAKTYYHVLNENEQKQTLSNDYLVSDNAVKAISNIKYVTNVKDENGKDLLDPFGFKEKKKIYQNPFDSIAGIRTNLYTAGDQFNPFLIKNAIETLEEYGYRLDKDFFGVKGVDEKTAHILNFISLCLKNNDNSDWVAVYNSFNIPESKIDTLSFLKEKYNKIVKVFGNEPVNNIDTYNYDKAIVKNGTGDNSYLTYFYNHITNSRFDIISNESNQGIGGHVDYICPLEFDFSILNNIDAKDALNAAGNLVIHEGDETTTQNEFNSKYNKVISILFDDYYLRNDDFYSLMYFSKKCGIELSDLIIAKELLIGAVKHYVETGLVSADYREFYTPYGPTGKVKTLERPYFNAYFK